MYIASISNTATKFVNLLPTLDYSRSYVTKLFLISTMISIGLISHHFIFQPASSMNVQKVRLISNIAAYSFAFFTGTFVLGYIENYLFRFLVSILITFIFKNIGNAFNTMFIDDDDEAIANTNRAIKLISALFVLISLDSILNIKKIKLTICIMSAIISYIGSSFLETNLYIENI